MPRWHEPGKGWVPPNLFLPVLEREGLLGELSERGARAGLRRTSATSPAQGSTSSISVDLAPDSLHDTELADQGGRRRPGRAASTRRA